MTRTILNPPGLHDPSGFVYSHLVTAPAGEHVYIAGQYGSGPDGYTISSDFAEQAPQTFTNLGIALRSAGLDYSPVGPDQNVHRR
jgi:enamine deaminase RidA (YjgF/YER057c/UK114 family)